MLQGKQIRQTEIDLPSDNPNDINDIMYEYINESIMHQAKNGTVMLRMIVSINLRRPIDHEIFFQENPMGANYTALKGQSFHSLDSPG